MPVPSRPAPTSRVLLRDVVYDMLYNAIVAGDLHPGEVLKEQEIEKLMNASRTPVREAIDRLTAMKLIEVLPQKETRVAPLDYKRFVQMVETLGVLFTEVIRETVPQLSKTEISNIESRAKALLRPSGANKNTPVITSDLLGYLAHVYGNSIVVSVKDSFIPHVQRVINANEQDEHFYMSTPLLKEFIKAIKERDADTAAAALESYFGEIVEYGNATLVPKQ